MGGRTVSRGSTPSDNRIMFDLQLTQTNTLTSRRQILNHVGAAKLGATRESIRHAIVIDKRRLAYFESLYFASMRL